MSLDLLYIYLIKDRLHPLAWENAPIPQAFPHIHPVVQICPQFLEILEPCFGHVEGYLVLSVLLGVKLAFFYGLVELFKISDGFLHVCLKHHEPFFLNSWWYLGDFFVEVGDELLADLLGEPDHVLLSTLLGLGHCILQAHHVLEKLSLVRFPSLAWFLLTCRHMSF